jgi:hypothetical protein
VSHPVEKKNVSSNNTSDKREKLFKHSKGKVGIHRMFKKNCVIHHILFILFRTQQCHHFFMCVFCGSYMHIVLEKKKKKSTRLFSSPLPRECYIWILYKNFSSLQKKSCTLMILLCYVTDCLRLSMSVKHMQYFLVLCLHFINNTLLVRSKGSHSNSYEEACLLRWNTM